MNIRLRLTAILLLVIPIALSGQIFERTDTLYIPDVETPPVIDGVGDDPAWAQVEWSYIDQIWMPYDNEPANIHDGLKLWEGPEDFTGRFKVVWSRAENLLYVLAEIVDDVFVDGYVAPNGGYHNYDVLELFIDEDRSGGEHVFDGVSFMNNMANCPTCNAENAFAYHINANSPNDGEVTTSMYAMDIRGSNWTNAAVDYASHFPEFALRKVDSLYTYEFSLIVHNDTYNHSNPEASISELYPSKVMGFSLAYCDNDDPDENPKQRDHFFGSVYMPEANQNDHWINADWFGVAKLTGDGPQEPLNPQDPQDPSTNSSVIKGVERISGYFTDGNLQISLTSSTQGEVQVRLINTIGIEVLRESFTTTSHSKSVVISSTHIPKGIYILELRQGNSREVLKVYKGI